MKRAKVLWFTGLSGAGKTTIAEALARRLRGAGASVKILDGDDVRATLHVHLGFTPDDIKENNRLIAGLCVQYQPDYDYILVPIISPFRESRADARRMIGEGFMEIYVRASLEEVMARDCKGLYKKAKDGQIAYFIGVDPRVPYEQPVACEVVLDTENDDVHALVRCLERVLSAHEAGAKRSVRHEK